MRRPGVLAAFFIAVLGVVGDPFVAAADDPAEPLLRAGVENRRAHRDEEALEDFQRAFAISPTPIARAQIALAEQALGRWSDAKRDLDDALAASADDWIARNRANLEAARAAIERHLAWLVVHVNVRGAEIRVDGRAIAAGEEAAVPSGPVHLDVVANGYVEAARPMDLAPGEHATVDVVLEEQPAARAAEPRWATDEPMIVTPPLRPARPPALQGPLALAGIGLGAVGVGAYFGLLADRDRARRDAECQDGVCSARAQSYGDSAQKSATVSDGAVAVGIGGVFLGSVWATLDAARSESTAPATRYAAPGALALVGLGGVAVGATLGVRAISAMHARDRACSAAGCGPEALGLDDQARSSALLSTVAVGAGALTVASAAGWIAWDRLAPARSGPGAGPFVLAGLGLVAAGASVYFTVRAAADKDARNAHCAGGACTPAAATDDADARTSASLATASVAATVPLLAGAAALWVWGKPGAPRVLGGVDVAPWVGPQAGGVVLHSSWR